MSLSKTHYPLLNIGLIQETEKKRFWTIDKQRHIPNSKNIIYLFLSEMFIKPEKRQRTTSQKLYY